MASPLAPERVRVLSMTWEAGGVLSLVLAGRGATGDGRAGQRVDVVCQRSGVTVSVATGQTVLEALEDAGLPVVSACQEGVCSTCETAVLEGDVDHRDSLLTPAEQAAGDTIHLRVPKPIATAGHRPVNAPLLVR